ncbi:thermonuclease family protein [Peptostreptococcus canis]|uniref:Nuclease n=1 Tax=Peptostreptococcus canis TaxID=1159213 RepID=A0ABR6TL81_9FIRM|nr:thermonuclease family protein [Peptostreptococcus canis]MBC2576163.1 nuclease [Peptostreptococcus canis]MBP1998304.1 micrococcal nuclease [Peptostreptococcus canis]
MNFKKMMAYLLSAVLIISISNSYVVDSETGQVSCEKAKVIKVVDGDTIKVNINGNKKTVRMIGVDTPETVHPKKPVMYYGQEASSYTKKQLSNKVVYLQRDVSDTDKYNRLLRYIWLKKPSTNPSEKEVIMYMYNAKLIKDGYGQLVTYPPDVKYTDLFRKLQKNAYKNKTGMWKEPSRIGNPANNKSNKVIGNKKSKIYHTSDQSSYNSVSDKNKVIFKNEDQAIKAGYRKSKK